MNNEGRVIEHGFDAQAHIT